MLRTLKTDLHKDLIEHFGEGYIEYESQLPYVVGYIFEIMSDAEKVGAERLEIPAHGSKVLSKASDVLKAFLQNDKTSMDVLSQAKRRTRAVQYALRHGELASVRIWNPQGHEKEKKGSI